MRHPYKCDGFKDLDSTKHKAIYAFCLVIDRQMVILLQNLIRCVSQTQITLSPVCTIGSCNGNIEIKNSFNEPILVINNVTVSTIEWHKKLTTLLDSWLYLKKVKFQRKFWKQTSLQRMKTIYFKRFNIIKPIRVSIYQSDICDLTWPWLCCTKVF